MLKKIITYSHCAVGFACASLFVEGAADVKRYYNQNNGSSGAAAHEHVVSGVELNADEKLIVAFAFETNGHGYQNSSVFLEAGGSVFSLEKVVTSDSGRFTGLYYLDLDESEHSFTSGDLGAIKIDLGTYSGTNLSQGYSQGDDVVDNLGATVMSVYGLVDGSASYIYKQEQVFEGSNSGTVALDTNNIVEGMFVTSAFTTNHSVVDSPSANSANNASLVNATYTSLYHTGVGSAGGSFGYISSFDHGENGLYYSTGHTGIESTSISYAAWEVVAVPEPGQVSVVIALLTICFCSVRRRVA